jgi:hypothetical protein
MTTQDNNQNENPDDNQDGNTRQPLQMITPDIKTYDNLDDNPYFIYLFFY